MEVVIVAGSVEVGAFAAGRIAEIVAAKPEAVLGVATGSSPLETYRALAARRDAGLDLSRVSAFALDEYVGIAHDHPESYHAVVDREVVQPLGLDASRVRVPDGLAADLDAAAEDYEAQIAAAGGVDVQLLGIGGNGHIGFNEPTSSLVSRTRVKTLAPATREANARFFDSLDQVPMHCLTQGLGTILDAKRALLVAQGASKAHAIAQIVEGPVSSMWPGSVLQLHRHATIVIDEAAASELTLTDYYRYTVEHRSIVQPDA
ncbi:glucosamine-6-phosphate deaminase [Agrococcus jejuensis]|uniref:glucosamine-6-phosphate deaminase n=1 Tax=Agrococcus jejuensis TaxID=399736 RepID=UPI00119EA74C